MENIERIEKSVQDLITQSNTVLTTIALLGERIKTHMESDEEFQKHTEKLLTGLEKKAKSWDIPKLIGLATSLVAIFTSCFAVFEFFMRFGK